MTMNYANSTKHLDKLNLTGEENLTVELLEKIAGVKAPKNFLRQQKTYHLYKALNSNTGNYQILDYFHIKAKDSWPNYIYVPLAMPIKYCGELHKLDVTKPQASQFIIDHKIMFMIGIWGKTQGIYKFDETVFNMVTHAKYKGKLLADVLTKLPEWCSYIEFPDGYTIEGVRTYGFYACISYNTHPIQVNEKAILEILIDAETGFLHRSLILDKNFDEMLTSLIGDRKVFESIIATQNSDPDYSNNTSKILFKQMSVAINCLLYLCSKNAEITHDKHPSKTPSNPKIIKDKVPNADHAHKWNVAYRIGAEIREALARHEKESKDNPDRNSPKPHVRRCHFHGYWIGDKSNQTFELQWLANIFVNVTPENQTVTTIRNVD